MEANLSQKQFENVFSIIKTRTYTEKSQEWLRCSYRDMSAEFSIPYNSVKTITSMLRTDPHIDYRFVQTESRFKPIQYKYIENIDDNALIPEKYPAFSVEEFEWLAEKLQIVMGDIKKAASYRDFSRVFITVEELKKAGFDSKWQMIKDTKIARMLNIDKRLAQQIIELLVENRILKRLGTTLNYRLILSNTDYDIVEAEQFKIQTKVIAENSKVALKEKDSDQFTVLTEMNDVESVNKEIMVALSELGSKVLQQQEYINSLRSKELVFAKGTVALERLNTSYSELKDEYAKMIDENNDLKQLRKKDNELFKEYQKNALDNLDVLSAHVISLIESYFNLPVFEKNKPSNVNKTKSEIIKFIIQISENIKTNTPYEE